MSKVVWSPGREHIEKTRIFAFAQKLSQKHGVALTGYPELYRFSIENYEAFWDEIWDFCGMIGDRNGSPVVVNADSIMRARFFPDARINFAENLLRRRGESAEAVTFCCEGEVLRRLTFRELDAEVSRLARALAAAGVRPGDRIAGYMPNIPETLIAMLAATALGAIWSVCSPDLGVGAVLDRLGQISPRILFVADGARYAGKDHSSLAKAAEIAAGIPSVERVVVVPYLQPDAALPDVPASVSWRDFSAPFSSEPLSFERFPFNHPVFILYTSGTTGRPKCIVHGAGGVLIQHMKEHQLHFDLRPGGKMLRFTTSGWMLWNALVTALASNASIVLADGSAMHPKPDTVFGLIDREGINVVGIPPQLLAALKREGFSPRQNYRLDSLTCLIASGSRVSPEEYVYAYDEIKRDFQFASASGGTDIMAAFGSGNPMGPCRAGEIPVLALGMKAQIFNGDAQPVVGEEGELVCTLPFPSVPLGFWGDDGTRLRESYFSHWPNVWRHGDWAEITENGGLVVHGRSDATLNVNGVRIGTAEIYRQVEAVEEVLESVVVAQDLQSNSRSILFVRMKPDFDLDESLMDKIRRRIREFASPRHVPEIIVQVADIPKTSNGKISELAVKDVIHGRPARNRSALSNPESLDQFANLPQLH